MTATFQLASIAPRLAAARDGFLAEVAFIRSERSRLNEVELHKRWLVEHRDLQQVRSGAAGRMSSERRMKWITRRDEKLDQAREELAEVLAEQAALNERERRLTL